ncbi:IGF-like family receptor 1 [Oryzias melastigma]|uniref:IGF-like family receptor 1 n=1 Tax=Oryzias melastigma TaxID=30732 RepID=UPI00168D3387|nr:IGF-like family receptor 1 [Oryzias melastigma]
MGHSHHCLDLTTFWNGAKCVPCQLRPGFEVTPNCGRDDNGGRHELAFKECARGTFNDGSRAQCRACSSCGPKSFPERNCTTTADTKCQEPNVTTVPLTTIQDFTPVEVPKDVSAAVWVVPLSILCVILLVFSAVLLKRHKGGLCVLVKQKQIFQFCYFTIAVVTRGRMCCKRRSKYDKPDFFSGSTSTGQSDPEEILSEDDVLSAPVQTLLDDLDVLEQLVILLDPETQGRKNTKHLASLCSFPSTWVTYTYSMRESKSPLKAVLEGVSSRHPDWTVGHMVKFLKQMDRNDAVAVLGKLKPCTYTQNYV